MFTAKGLTEIMHLGDHFGGFVDVVEGLPRRGPATKVSASTKAAVPAIAWPTWSRTCRGIGRWSRRGKFVEVLVAWWICCDAVVELVAHLAPLAGPNLACSSDWPSAGNAAKPLRRRAADLPAQPSYQGPARSFRLRSHAASERKGMPE